MEMDEFFKQSEALWNSGEMRGFMHCISVVAGFHLSDRDKAPFLTFHKYITAPQPAFISEWRANPKQERWHQLLVNGFLGNVQNSFACVRYHQERVKAIELAAHACFESSGIKEQMGESTMGGGNTLALDFEYQAYVLAYRRCLDQLSRTLSAYFKNDHNSFRRLPKLLEKAKPRSAAIAISEVVTRHSRNFDFVLSEDGSRSVRDRIAHYEFVPAGVMNISIRGFCLAGGGEALAGGTGPILLQDVLVRRSEELHLCLAELVAVFIAESGKHEGAV